MTREKLEKSDYDIKIDPQSCEAANRMISVKNSHLHNVNFFQNKGLYVLFNCTDLVEQASIIQEKETSQD